MGTTATDVTLTATLTKSFTINGKNVTFTFDATWPASLIETVVNSAVTQIHNLQSETTPAS